MTIKTLLTILVIFGLTIPTFAGIPHPAGGPIPFEISDDISFVAYINGREEEILTENSVGSGINSSSGLIWVDAGNFITNWSVGDRIHIEVFKKSSNDRAIIEGELTSAANDEFYGVVADSILNNPILNGEAQPLSACLSWDTVNGYTYDLYRADGVGRKFSRISIDYVDSSYSDENLLAEQSYYYILIARNGTSLIGFSDVLCATPMPQVEGRNITDLSESGYKYNFDVTGREYGNSIDETGRFIPGNKEGAFIITTIVDTGTEIITTQDTVHVNLGAPRIIVTMNDEELSDNQLIDSEFNFDINIIDGNGIASIKVFIDGEEISSGINSFAAEDLQIATSFKPEIKLGAGTHTMVIESVDNLGSKSTLTIKGLSVSESLDVTGVTRNYPNPFTPSSGTTIYYNMTQSAEVKIMIYDLSGRQIHSILCAQGLEGGLAGENKVVWDAKNAAGQTVANGVYVYFLISEGRILDKGEMACYE